MPERTCLGCRQVREKKELVRLVSKNGALEADLKGSLPGRGAYICKNEKCLKEAFKRKDLFTRALKTKIELPDEQGLWVKIQEN